MHGKKVLSCPHYLYDNPCLSVSVRGANLIENYITRLWNTTYEILSLCNSPVIFECMFAGS